MKAGTLGQQNVHKKFTTNHTNQHELLPHILSVFVLVRGGSW